MFGYYYYITQKRKKERFCPGPSQEDRPAFVFYCPTVRSRNAKNSSRHEPHLFEYCICVGVCFSG